MLSLFKLPLKSYSETDRQAAVCGKPVTAVLGIGVGYCFAMQTFSCGVV